MPTYTVNSFTPNQTPLSQAGDFATAYGVGVDVDGSGSVVGVAGLNVSYLLPAVATWDRASMFIEADLTYTGGAVGVGWYNDSGSAAEHAGIGFYINSSSTSLLREYTDASSLDSYAALSEPTWTGTIQRIGILLTDAVAANTMDYAIYVDTGSGLQLADTNATGTITMEDGVTSLQPWLAAAGGGDITAMEARDALSGVSIVQTDDTPEDGVLQTVTCTGMTGPITAATLSGYDILSLLSGTDPSVAITYTLDVSATEASQGAPRIGETSTLSFTTATDGSVTTDVTIQPKTGWTRTVLAGTLDKSANGFLATLDAQLGVTSAVGDIIYFDVSSNAAITATGVYTSDLTSAGQKTDFVIQQGGSATTTATSEGGSFYPFGVSGNQIRTKFRRFPWQTHYKL